MTWPSGPALARSFRQDRTRLGRSDHGDVPDAPVLDDLVGSTETNLVIGTDVDDSRPGSMGVLREGFSARVVDERHVPVPDGTPGELVVRSHQRLAFSTGYLGDPVEPPHSWRRTGDRVVRDPDGRYRFVDRIKNVIRRRGENISSHEVEAVVRTHPSVAEAAAYPVPSDLAEDEVMVAVLIRPGHALDPGDLVRHCERELPPFAVPRYIEACRSSPSPRPARSARSHYANAESPRRLGTATKDLPEVMVSSH